MKIFLRDIPLNGLDVSEEIAPEVIDRREDDDYHFTECLKVKAYLEKIEDAVIARMKMRSKVEAVCYRCLEKVIRDWEMDFILDFPIEPGKDFIDMTEEIRQEAILGFPDRELCKEGCKGICAGCGVNFNNEKCSCRK